MKLFFAPLQGYTDFVYRKIHNEIVGGVDAYFMPFLRWDGGLRNKDLRDIMIENNEGMSVVPQVIAANVDELNALLDVVEGQGYNRVDLNMGCPFPLQTGRGRGAALLSHPDVVHDMMEEILSRKGLHVSVKMRCGMTQKADGLVIIDLLNDYDLEFVTIHPRLGNQQYKGAVDMEVFSMMAERSRNPVVYNGDLATVEQMKELESRFPKLYGIMIGRGLLARPSLAKEWRDGVRLTETEVFAITMKMHNRLYDYACKTLQGEQQILSRMRAFWEYQQPLVDKKVYKRLMKAGNLKNYLAVLECV